MRSANSPGDTLDHDLLRCVFSFLDARSLQQAFLVCKSWAGLADDEVLWKALMQSEWPELATSTCAPSAVRHRFLSLWRAENMALAGINADTFTLEQLNEAYTFIVSVKDAGRRLLGSGGGAVRLTTSQAHAGAAMGGGEYDVDNAILFTCAFKECQPLCLPNGILSERDDTYVEVYVHVRRVHDEAVAHLLTCTIDHYTFQDSFEYGFLTGVGVGPVRRRGYAENMRTGVPWTHLITHALHDAPSDGKVTGEIETTYAEGQEVGEEYDYESVPGLGEVRLKFAKNAVLGQEGPFAPAFETPLTLPDMPAILASLDWV